jgi:hypothetical protein
MATNIDSLHYDNSNFNYERGAGLLYCFAVE